MKKLNSITYLVKTVKKRSILIPIILLFSFTLVLLLAGKLILLPFSGVSTQSKSDVIPTVIQAKETTTPTTTPTPTPTPTVEIQNMITTTPIPLPSTSAIQNTKTDTSLRIEQCRANAEQQKMNYIQAGDNLLAQERPEIVELVSTSNTQQTEDIALKYGTIQQSQVVHVADVYQKLVNEGMSQSNATDMASFLTKKWWEYLQSLHNWAVKEKNDYEATIETKANNSKNEYYIKCLNYEN